MIYSGKSITVKTTASNTAELCFDAQDGSVNKLDTATLLELKEAIAAVAASEVKGLLITSAKDAFIVGADITEFGAMFAKSERAIARILLDVTGRIFNPLEDLQIPTVTAINGYALGGGLELALSTDYRVMATTAKIGLPETKLGIIPGFGGTVRLPRVIGADNAIEWIASGGEQRADAAMAVGAVDAVVAPEQLHAAGADLLTRCVAGEFDFRAKRAEKLEPLKVNNIEAMMVFETSKAFVAGKAGPHYPAPVAAIQLMQKACTLDRDEALLLEAEAFSKMAKTPVAKNLIGLFLGDQLLTKTAKEWAKQGAPVSAGAVLGAGIMGGGIAYQSALKGVPITMKDVAQKGLDLGLAEAGKLLAGQVERGRMSTEKMLGVLSAIRPTLSYDGINQADMVVEAVVENAKVKKSVLAEVEGLMADDAVLASNTSTISIDTLAEDLKRPESFCGMHFFNPVHRMPLVEVIRGSKTSDTTVGRTVAYALSMGKKPVVINNCPGFLVNRVLMPYMGAFMQLLQDGADFIPVDKVMEKFGWPMGPAYLSDVIGTDTAVHAGDIVAQGYPSRMGHSYKTASHILLEAGRLGQKNGKGYYRYEPDRRGKPQKQVDDSVWELLPEQAAARKTFDDNEIIERLMIPLCMESVRCLEEGIAASAVDVDMALIYGIGFPPFRGGALHYIDDMGVANFVAAADRYVDLGEMYVVTDKLREMAAKGETFFPQAGAAESGKGA